ncbi:hypothetical protein WA026_006480, partial [Henosepilachna vigintioctopunctata]
MKIKLRSTFKKPIKSSTSLYRRQTSILLVCSSINNRNYKGITQRSKQSKIGDITLAMHHRSLDMSSGIKIL